MPGIEIQSIILAAAFQIVYWEARVLGDPAESLVKRLVDSKNIPDFLSLPFFIIHPGFQKTYFH
jgi:hypothetical protein